MESSSIVKAFSLVELLAELKGSGSLNQVALGTGMTKPSAHRILRCLVELGYVQHDSGGIYRLTPKLHWVALGRSDRRLASVADPLLRRLHQQTAETVNLGVLRRNRVVYITVLESSHPLRRVAEPHESDPIFSTALGRAIGAFCPRQRSTNCSPQRRLKCELLEQPGTKKTCGEFSRGFHGWDMPSNGMKRISV